MSTQNKPLPLVIMGTGPNARETRSIVNAINKAGDCDVFDFVGFVLEPGQSGSAVQGMPIACDDDSFKAFAKKYIRLGVAIPAANPAVKKKIYDKLKALTNLEFPGIIHPRANILEPETVKMGKGCIITAGVFVSISVEMGDFVYFNYNCSIGHDTVIGDFCTVNPQAAVGGDIRIQDRCLIGADSAIKQGCTIGEDAVIGLGAFVVHSVQAGAVMVCRPAEPLLRRDEEASR